jgi:hypothetical protein
VLMNGKKIFNVTRGLSPSRRVQIELVGPT